MQQILQNLKTGSTEVVDVPCPYVAAGQLLIGTRVSLISAGTERMLVEFGQAKTCAGVIVPPECPTAMARAIRDLYHDKAVVERSAMHALRAAPQFSREQQARDLIQIFEQVVGIAP